MTLWSKALHHGELGTCLVLFASLSITNRGAHAPCNRDTLCGVEKDATLGKSGEAFDALG
jgi:hypothetical protein